MCEFCPAQPGPEDGIVHCSVCGTDQTVVSHEEGAVALCRDSVRLARDFSCEAVRGGWLFTFHGDRYRPDLLGGGSLPAKTE